MKALWGKLRHWNRARRFKCNCWWIPKEDRCADYLD